MILATFAKMEPQEAREHKPVVVRVDSKNRIVSSSTEERPGPEMPVVIDESAALKQISR